MSLSNLDKERLALYVREHNLPQINKDTKPVVPKNTIYSKYIKRLLDIVLSLLAMIITFPVNICIAICTYFDVGRPIIFRQYRPGYKGEKFEIIKFRNMTNELDENGELLPISQRVTKFGKFVRRTSLDELLNFVCILKGQMSIVGPRPLAEVYWDRYSDRHRMRHWVRPGLECPNIRGDLRSGWNDQFENDIWYVENVSFITDIRMCLGIVGMFMDRKIRKMHAETGVEEGDFIGYDVSGRAFGEDTIPKEYLELLREGKI